VTSLERSETRRRIFSKGEQKKLRIVECLLTLSGEGCFVSKGGKKLDDARTSYNTIFFAGVVTVSFRSETISVQDQVSSR